MRRPRDLNTGEAYPHLAHIFKKGRSYSECVKEPATFDVELDAWITWGIRRWKSKPATDESQLCPYCLKHSRERWTKRRRT